MKRPAPLRFLWDQHRPTLVMLAVAMAVAVFFAIRFLGHAVYWQQVHSTDPMIERWMTPKYIANAWDVPVEVLVSFLALPQTHDRPTMSKIARAQNRPVEAVIAELTAHLGSLKAPNR